MSRLGKKPIKIPNGVEVNLSDGRIKVKGPKGELERELHPFVTVEINGDEIWVKPNLESAKRKSDEKKMRVFQGTYWSHIRNMIEGVTKGFEKKLAVVGIGYRALMQGNTLVLNVGYAHPVDIAPPNGISFAVDRDPKNNWFVITVSGIDKELVGQVAANIRKVREPDSYKGKGIRYLNEEIRLKAGKKV